MHGIRNSYNRITSVAIKKQSFVAKILLYFFGFVAVTLFVVTETCEHCWHSMILVAAVAEIFVLRRFTYSNFIIT